MPWAPTVISNGEQPQLLQWSHVRPLRFT